MISLDAIHTMSLDEKIRLMEMLWAEMSQSSSLEMPNWHGDVLEQRANEIDSGKGQFTDWSVAKKRIRKKLK